MKPVLITIVNRYSFKKEYYECLYEIECLRDFAKVNKVKFIIIK